MQSALDLNDDESQFLAELDNGCNSISAELTASELLKDSRSSNPRDVMQSSAGGDDRGEEELENEEVKEDNEEHQLTDDNDNVCTIELNSSP